MLAPLSVIFLPENKSLMGLFSNQKSALVEVVFTKIMCYIETMKKKLRPKLNLNVIFRTEPEGGFTVLVPALPGCITYGKNIQEAKKMAEEAITLYLEDMAAEGEELPQNEQTYLGNIELYTQLSSQLDFQKKTCNQKTA